jgi:hypothetical protein
VDYFTGLDFDAQLVDTVVIIVFIIAITASISLNLKDLIIYMRKRQK